MRIIESEFSLGEPREFGYGYSLGIQIQLIFKDNIFLRSGPNHQRTIHQHKENQLGFAINGPNDPLPFVRRSFDVSSIEIPIEIGYLIKLKNGKVSFPIGIGGSINIELADEIDSKIVSVHYGEQTFPSQDDNIDSSIYSIVLFGGIEFNLGEKIILGIEPNFRFAPNRFTFDRINPKAKTRYETGFTLRLRLDM